jgi:uncharacterized SAM-dependent methyltransferase
VTSFAQVRIHSSQFPERVQRDLLESLRTRQVNHKFHYDSIKQTNKWLALHDAYSPFRTDPDCVAIYQRSFEQVTKPLSGSVHVVGLGCGGGRKDTLLLKLLSKSNTELYYTPSDVSVAMVLVARQAALEVVDEARCFPLVCDLVTAEDLAGLLRQFPGSTTKRLITFFGMLPNFELNLILPRLAAMLEAEDRLLVSANLAPGSDYGAGMQKILPLYNNELTRDWLLTFLLDLGFERGDGSVRFEIEDDPAGTGLKRIVSNFEVVRSREIKVDSERFEFQKGDTIRLLFSYRHTPAMISSLLPTYGLQVEQEWISKSEEEGVFLVSKL